MISPMTSHSERIRKNGELIIEGEVIKPYTHCKHHGYIYDISKVRKEFDERKKTGYFYFRCLECRQAYRRGGNVSREEKKRIKEAIYAKVAELTGNAPVVKNVQKKVVNMFLSINRSTKK